MSKIILSDITYFIKMGWIASKASNPKTTREYFDYIGLAPVYIGKNSEKLFEFFKILNKGRR